MKNIKTIILAAILSGCMITCMAACNNGGGQNTSDGGTSVVNPFDLNSQASVTDTSAASDTSAPDSSVVAPTESSAESVVSTVSADISDTASEPSTPASEPTVSGTSDLPLPSGDDDESDISDISDDDESDDDSSVVPHGTVMAEYVGKWTYVFDLSGMTPEEASTYQALITMLNPQLTFDLGADGSVSMFMSESGESSTTTGGSWVAEGNKIYVTFDGESIEMIYANGKMTAEEFEGGYFVKS